MDQLLQEQSVDSLLLSCPWGKAQGEGHGTRGGGGLMNVSDSALQTSSCRNGLVDNTSSLACCQCKWMHVSGCSPISFKVFDGICRCQQCQQHRAFAITARKGPQHMSNHSRRSLCQPAKRTGVLLPLLLQCCETRLAGQWLSGSVL